MNTMDDIFSFLDQKQEDAVVQIIKEHLGKREQDFIEDLVPSLNIIADSSVEVVRRIMPNLLTILNFDDDLIRYSMIIALKNFVEEHKELIFPYIEDFLLYGSPKKREGMLLLLKYVADSDPESLEPYYGLLVDMLSDSEDFVRRKVVEILKTVGKVDRSEIEAKILNHLEKAEDLKDIKDQNDQILKEAQKVIQSTDQESPIAPEDNLLISAADEVIRKSTKEKADLEEIKKGAQDVLKEIAVSSLEKEELETRKLEAESKALEEKLKEEEEKLRIEKLRIEEEKRIIEQKRLEQEKERLTREQALLDKKRELEQVKQELEMKRLEEEQNEIIEKENKRIKKKLEAMSQDAESDDDYEELI